MLLDRDLVRCLVLFSGLQCDSKENDFNSTQNGLYLNLQTMLSLHLASRQFLKEKNEYVPKLLPASINRDLRYMFSFILHHWKSQYCAAYFT